MKALYLWNGSGLNVLVPKKRGKGYLKVPFGHHPVPALSDIEVSESVDMDGLDGMLTLQYGYTYPDSKRQAIVDRVMPRLAEVFKFKEWEEVSNDAFFDTHNRQEATTRTVVSDSPADE